MINVYNFLEKEFYLKLLETNFIYQPCVLHIMDYWDFPVISIVSATESNIKAKCRLGALVLDLYLLHHGRINICAEIYGEYKMIWRENEFTEHFQDFVDMLWEGI